MNAKILTIFVLLMCMHVLARAQKPDPQKEVQQREVLQKANQQMEAQQNEDGQKDSMQNENPQKGNPQKDPDKSAPWWLTVPIIMPAEFNYDRTFAPGAIYKFEIRSSMKMVEVEDPGSGGGTKVQQWEWYERNGFCDGKNQQWFLIPAGRIGSERTFYIINYGFLKYLTAGPRSRQTADGVTVENPSNNSNQLWLVRPVNQNQNNHSYVIKSVSNDTYLTAPAVSDNDGEILTLEDLRNNSAGSNQVFNFINLGQPDLDLPHFSSQLFFWIQPSYNNQKFLNLPAGNTQNGTVITIWDGNQGGTNLQWQLISDAAGYYEIKPRPAHGAKSISVAYASMDNSANLTLYDCVDADNQKWIIIPVVRERGKFIFFNKNSGKCMDVAGGNVSDNNTLVQQYVYLNQDNCKWTLISFYQ